MDGNFILNNYITFAQITDNMKKIVLLALLTVFLSENSNAQKSYKDKNYWVSQGVEGSLIQFAQAEIWNRSATTIPRYTYFFNMGSDYNYKLGHNASIFTGLNLKNIGLILKSNDSLRSKHRVYTVGAPIGFKIHSADRSIKFKAGVDLSMAINYKWKTIASKNKTKDHEFFSDRTALFHPSAFVGISIKGLSITANSYLRNFFNPYHPANTNFEARLFTLGIGFDIDSKKLNPKKRRPVATPAEEKIEESN